MVQHNLLPQTVFHTSHVKTWKHQTQSTYYICVQPQPFLWSPVEFPCENDCNYLWHATVPSFVVTLEVSNKEHAMQHMLLISRKSYCVSFVTFYKVYQESTTSRGGPGGVRETQHSVVDSSKGLRKMAIGHHIGDRARILERERNPEGEEEREELLNLDDGW